MKMARKFLISILICSASVFAVGFMPINAACASETSLNRLDDGQFWSKFRDSVMKDKPNSDNEQPGDQRDDRPREPHPPKHK